MDEIVNTTPLELVPVQFESVGVEELIAAFLSGKSVCTIRAYETDLHSFRKFLKVATLSNAIHALLDRPQGPMNLLVLQFRAAMERRLLSKSTINRALSALRSIVELANTLGVVSGRILSVPNFKSVSYKDCSGPGQDGFKSLLQAAAKQRPEKAARDTAILWLLYSPALRRNEVATLELQHVKVESGTILVVGKGYSERIPLTIPSQTVEAIRKWLAFRGGEPGSLFRNFDRAVGDGAKRLSANGIFRIIKSLATKASVQTGPHGLRHSGITAALDATNGNIRTVSQFSRHRNVQTIIRYDDARNDKGGEVAQLVANAVTA